MVEDVAAELIELAPQLAKADAGLAVALKLKEEAASALEDAKARVQESLSLRDPIRLRIMDLRARIEERGHEESLQLVGERMAKEGRPDGIAVL